MSENLTQPPDLNITTQSSIDLEITTTDKPGTWLNRILGKWVNIKRTLYTQLIINYRNLETWKFNFWNTLGNTRTSVIGIWL